jgi:hypothetical protein
MVLNNGSLMDLNGVTNRIYQCHLSSNAVGSETPELNVSFFNEKNVEQTGQKHCHASLPEGISLHYQKVYIYIIIY